MELADFAALAIVGAAVSLVVQFIKANTFFSPRLAVILLSFGAGTAYFFIRDTAVWQAALSVLATADVVYLHLLKPAFQE